MCWILSEMHLQLADLQLASCKCEMVLANLQLPGTLHVSCHTAWRAQCQQSVGSRAGLMHNSSGGSAGRTTTYPIEMFPVLSSLQLRSPLDTLGLRSPHGRQASSVSRRCALSCREGIQIRYAEMWLGRYECYWVSQVTSKRVASRLVV